MSSNLTKITRFRFVNAFLVSEEDGLTLIDTTVPGGAEKIIGEAERLGRPIVRILLTHAHGDHVGSLDGLVDRLEGVQVGITARDAKLLRKDKSPEAGEPEDAKMRGHYPGVKTRPTVELSPGDRIGSLEVVPAPGHTPGQIAFLDTRDHTLIAGDAYGNLRGQLVTSAKVTLGSPLPALATWHRPTALQTARELRALDPSSLALGHGAIVQAPGAAMDQAIAAAQ